MKNSTKFRFSLKQIFGLMLLTFFTMGCEKNANPTTYEWSATIDGVNYDYSMPSSTPTDQGKCHMANPTTSTISSSIVLCDESGYPAITFSSTTPLVVGTYTFNAQSNPQNNVGIARSSPQSFPDVFSTMYPNAQITLNITSVGAVGGVVEGNFSGSIGKAVPPSSITYVNMSGTFKAYIQN